jgi:putative membrane protein
MRKHQLLVAGVLAIVVCGAATAQNAAKLTDPQIAHIAYTAGQIDIQAAQQALQKSQNPKVREFASDMVRDHTSVNQQALDLCKKLNVTPEENDTSKSLVKQADEERTKLAGMSGAAFDKAYAENEVAYHHTVNTTLANTLIPSTTNAQLKDLLSTGLKIFQGHEEHAQSLADGLK